VARERVADAADLLRAIAALAWPVLVAIVLAVLVRGYTVCGAPTPHGSVN